MRILYFTEKGVSGGPRGTVFIDAMRAHGHEVEVHQRVEINQAMSRTFDLAIFLRPMYDATEIIRILHQGGCRCLADVDDDFYNIPKTSMAYPGVIPHLSEHTRTLSQMDGIITPSEILQDRLRKRHPTVPIWYVPNSWKDSPIWQYHKPSDQFRIGWAGSLTHRQDFGQCVTPLISILKKYPQTQVVIGADYEIYNKFASFPESRKLFVPGVLYEYYPLMLSNFDLLLAPLEPNDFNLAKSDIKLMDACAKRIPYVASRLPQYESWKSSFGWMATTYQEWYEAMDHAIQRPYPFYSFSREITQIYPLYEDVLRCK